MEEEGVSRPQNVMGESLWRTMEEAKCVGRVIAEYVGRIVKRRNRQSIFRWSRGMRGERDRQRGVKPRG
jgi:hypothetical protein